MRYEEAPIHDLAQKAAASLDEACKVPTLWKTRARREVAIHWLWGDFRYPASLHPRYRWIVFRRKVRYVFGVARDLWKVL